MMYSFMEAPTFRYKKWPTLAEIDAEEEREKNWRAINPYKKRVDGEGLEPPTTEQTPVVDVMEQTPSPNDQALPSACRPTSGGT